MHMKTRQKLAIAVIVLLLASCTSLGNYFRSVPAYDQKSFESFTYLKADILMFYDTLGSPFDEAKYTDFIIRFNRMGEYEAGKKGNEEIVNQLAIIRDMFTRHCNDARVRHYSQIMIDNKKEVIGAAFDVLISTEYSKKK